MPGCQNYTVSHNHIGLGTAPDSFMRAHANTGVALCHDNPVYRRLEEPLTALNPRLSRDRPAWEAFRQYDRTGNCSADHVYPLRFVPPRPWVDVDTTPSATPEEVLAMRLKYWSQLPANRPRNAFDRFNASSYHNFWIDQVVPVYRNPDDNDMRGVNPYNGVAIPW